jgi:hypothetical protein
VWTRDGIYEIIIISTINWGVVICPQHCTDTTYQTKYGSYLNPIYPDSGDNGEGLHRITDDSLMLSFGFFARALHGVIYQRNTGTGIVWQKGFGAGLIKAFGKRFSSAS